MTPFIHGDLQADRKQFLSALRQVKAHRKSLWQTVLLELVEGKLQLNAGCCSFLVDCQGTWRGQAEIPPDVLVNLAKAPPRGTGPIHVSTDGHEVRIDTIVARCRWRELATPRLEMPLGASLVEVLLLRLLHSAEEIEHAGLTDAVRAAEDRRKKLLREIVRSNSRLAGLLAELGLGKHFEPLKSADELRRQHDELLKRLAQNRRSGQR